MKDISEDLRFPYRTDTNTPLVSILIYNYNYGRYLSECFQSALDQSYPNIEILFSDNASDDNSWEIALDFQRRYPGRITIARNRSNLGTDLNLQNCFATQLGRYYVVLGSDDVLHKDFVKVTTALLTEHFDAAYVMTHRYILDKDGNRTEEVPFYDGCYKLIPPSQNGVYMMAAINPSITQICYRTDQALRRSAMGEFGSQFYGTRIMDFRLCMDFPVVYIDAPLVGHRIHGENQSLVADKNLMEILGPYVLNLQFREIGRLYSQNIIEYKFNKSGQLLAKLALRYSLRAAKRGDIDLGLQYWHLSQALYPEIRRTAECSILGSFFGSEIPKHIKELEIIDSSMDFQRKVSYPPDEPFIKLDKIKI
jgi:glycosyltransferase involved in cell wall biosynthesis